MAPLLRMATTLLEKNGEFYPFAGFLDSTGRFQQLAAYDGDEHPASAHVIEDLRRILQSSASQNHYRAIGLVYDVRVVPPGSRDKTDAVLIELEHQSGYRVNVYWPYTKRSTGAPSLGAAFAVAGTLHGYTPVPSPDR